MGMRKILVLGVILIIVCLIVFIFGTRFGIKIGNIYIAPSVAKKILEELSYSFWEDIQFKDFERAATYHEPALQALLDIPYLIERLFMIKPEHLDIQRIEILDVDLDADGERGRVRTKLIVKMLLDGKIREPEIILYWYKKEGQWYMRLESSLHQLEEDRSKKQTKKLY